jgi:hypothetical protein
LHLPLADGFYAAFSILRSTPEKSPPFSSRFLKGSRSSAFKNRRRSELPTAAEKRSVPRDKICSGTD